MDTLGTPWPPGTVERVAIAYEANDEGADRIEALSAVADECGVEAVVLLGWVSQDLFAEQLRAARAEVRDSGKLFKIKAATLAEANLDSVAGVLQDSKQTGQTRLKAFELLAKLGGFDTRGDAQAAVGGGGGGPVVNINFASRPEKSIVIAPPDEAARAVEHQRSPADPAVARAVELAERG